MTAEPPGPADEAPSAADTRWAGVADGLRFAFGTLTAVPVRVSRWDRAGARTGMLCAPLAGLAVGLCAAAAGGMLHALGAGGLLSAVAGVGTGAALTRGLHLDGLADTADGLGSGAPAEEALRVMRQSDIGPFGVVTLVLVLGAQVAALARAYDTSWAAGGVALALAATVARLALTLAVRTGVPAARTDGLGATVAGSVPVGAARCAALATLLAATGVGALFGALGAVRCALAVLCGCGAAALLRRHCTGRLGGVTGDVLGALAETAATAALVVLACAGPT